MARIPLEYPDATVAGPDASADDMLSQLAGNEIDRLLQEAETSVADSASAAAPSHDAEAEAEKAIVAPLPQPQDLKSAEPALEKQLDSLLAEMKAPPPPDQKQDIPQAERTALLGEVGLEKAQAAALAREVLESSTQSSSAQTPAATASPAPDASATENIPEGDERSALLAAAGFEMPDGTPITPHPENASGSPMVEVKIPAMLKPLVWLNAPLAHAPRIAKKILGGVAVVTMLNAIGLIVYVMVFRKH